MIRYSLISSAADRESHALGGAACLSFEPRNDTASASNPFRSVANSPTIRRLFSVFLLLHACLHVTSAAFGGDFVVFSKTYVRGTGAPETVTDTFDVLNPATTWTLHVTNGSLEDDTIERVSSSTLALNGTELLQESDFNQNVEMIQIGATVLPTNTVSVQLRSKPGGRLTVKIVGVDDVAPTLEWDAPLSDEFIEDDVVLASLSLADDFSGLDPASLSILLDGDAVTESFSALSTPTLDAVLSADLPLDVGPHTLTAQVNDLAGNLGAASVSFTVVPGIPPPASLGSHTMITSSPTVTIGGTVMGGANVEVSGPEGTFLVPVTNDTFSAEVPLRPNSINHLFFTVISADGRRGPPISTIVTQDSQPPNLFIDFPTGGAEITTATADVGGRVGDLLAGFMGLDVALIYIAFRLNFRALRLYETVDLTSDALTVTRNTLYGNGNLNMRITGVFAWNRLTRITPALGTGGELTGPNTNAKLYGIFTESDFYKSTVNFDVGFVDDPEFYAERYPHLGEAHRLREHQRQVDEGAFESLVDWQIEQGTNGVVPCGTTGESPTLSHDEQMRVTEICIGVAKGR
ncbi:MAG: dihydrodipicolinate synthase family protein, partial [Planctomycetes bacterium]|nr:dihydrodipicolinate synthase family protein [Planctomycetota bacterium]